MYFDLETPRQRLSVQEWKGGEQYGPAERKAEFSEELRDSVRRVFGVAGHERGRARTYEDASRITVYR